MFLLLLRAALISRTGASQSHTIKYSEQGGATASCSCLNSPGRANSCSDGKQGHPALPRHKAAFSQGAQGAGALGRRQKGVPGILDLKSLFLCIFSISSLGGLLQRSPPQLLPCRGRCVAPPRPTWATNPTTISCRQSPASPTSSF